MSTESGSFFERYPWTGAAIFGAILVVVGIFLATTIGERPHYRAEWRLVSEAPAQGAVPKNSDFQTDPVRIQVALHVQDEDNGPGLGLKGRLVEPASATVLSEGVTSGPGGHLNLPVPARFDQILFGGGLSVEVERRNGEVVSKAVPVPNRGKVGLTIRLGEFPMGAASGVVTDESGKPVAGALVMIEWVDPPAGIFTTQGPSLNADERGRFHFGAIEAQGKARLSAFAGKRSFRMPDATVLPTHSLRLPVQASGSIRGELAGDSLPTIERIGLMDQAGSLRALGRSISLNAATFRIDGVPAGNYRLGVVDRNGTARALREITLDAGGDLDLGKLEL